MEGAVRVFAGEFGRSSLSVPGEDDGSPAFVVTPGGAYCRLIYITGALTEVDESGDFIRGRVADPTGGFDLVTGGKNPELSLLLRNLPLPAFVSALGRAQLYRRNGTISLSIRPDHVVVVDRAVRDQWVLVTAASTLRRLEELQQAIRGQNTSERICTAIRHYNVSDRDLEDLALMVESAVQSVRPPGIEIKERSDARERVLGLIRESRSPRGIAVQEIVDRITKDGISQENVLSAIESLIVDDECYQPQKGFVRLL
ncbi:hypothetical protein [uncultured Methanoregula sp.]|uniref:hypothetical protein n=1 Tax=uncultured Methanoregula sp. TaxID=1005933 RepID=UPI002AABE128|nr:hypothetical protein [uncultured Methanoregula sp.]